MANMRIATVSDPPALTTENLARLEIESQRLREAFRRRTERMEQLDGDDLRRLVR